MQLFKNKIIYLLKVYSSGKATYAEEQLLFKWLNNNDDKQLIIEHIESVMKEYKPAEIVAAVKWEMIFQNIINNIK